MQSQQQQRPSLAPPPPQPPHYQQQHEPAGGLMDPGRSEVWQRPFKCAICGRRAADKFTIEQHVQFEHGGRDLLVSAPPHQLRLSAVSPGGSSSYGSPFRGLHEDGLPHRMYTGPSPLNPPRYVQQALRSASGELLGWKAVIDPGISERYASNRPVGLRASIRRGPGSTMAASSKRSPWSDPFYAQPSTPGSVLEHMRCMSGPSAELDQRHYQSELASVERGSSYMTSGSPSTGQIYPHGVVRSCAEQVQHRSVQIARPSADGQRQPHLLAASALLGTSRYVQVSGAASPAEDHLQGHLHGPTAYSPYHSQLSQMSATSGLIGGTPETKTPARASDNAYCQPKAGRVTSDSLQRHLQMTASTQVEPSSLRSPQMYHTTSSSVFPVQRVHAYTTGHTGDLMLRQMPSEHPARLPMPLISDERGNPLASGGPIAATQLYATPKSGQIDSQGDGCSSGQSKSHTMTTGHDTYVDGRRGFMPSSSYSSGQYYHSTESLPEQFRPQADNGLLTASGGEQGKQSSASFTELGSYSSGPRHMTAQDRPADNQDNVSTGLRGQLQGSSYESGHIEQVPQPFAGPSGHGKRDIQLTDQYADSPRQDFANSVSFSQSGYMEASTSAGSDPFVKQESASSNDLARHEESGGFTNSERSQCSHDQLQVSAGDKTTASTLSEKREASDELESAIFKRRQTIAHSEVSTEDDKENHEDHEDMLSESQEDESDDTISMAHSGRCQRCGCAVRGQCDNPNSLLEPDKIVIITNPNSTTTTAQMTSADEGDVAEDLSESTPEVVLPDSCYDQPADGENPSDCGADSGGSSRVDVDDFSRLTNKHDEDPTSASCAAEDTRLVRTIDDSEQLGPNVETSMPIETNLQAETGTQDCDLTQ